MTVAQEDVDELDPELIDPEILDRLPPDIRKKLEDGVLDKIPEDVVDALPPSLQERLPEGFIDAAGSNPTLTAILVIAGIVGILGFMYGVAKSAFKAAAFFAIVAAVAWIWFANR